MYATGSRRTRRRTMAPKRLRSGRVHPAFAAGAKRGRIDPHRVREQDLGVEPRRIDPGGGQSVGGGGQRLAHGACDDRAHAVCVSSRARFSSPARASVNSSRLPPRTPSRSCEVTLTR